MCVGVHAPVCVVVCVHTHLYTYESSEAWKYEGVFLSGSSAVSGTGSVAEFGTYQFLLA